MPPLDYGSPPERFFQNSGTQTTQVSRLIELAAWARGAQERVRELAGLQQGWDGRNSAPINRNVSSHALALIDVLTKLGMPKPHIVPVSGGGLQMEWRNSANELEVEISPDGSVDFLIVDASGVIKTGEVQEAHNIAAITQVTSWFLAGKECVSDLNQYAAY